MKINSLKDTERFCKGTESLHEKWRMVRDVALKEAADTSCLDISLKIYQGKQVTIREWREWKRSQKRFHAVFEELKQACQEEGLEIEDHSLYDVCCLYK